MSFAVQHHSIWLPQTSATFRSAWTQMFALSISIVLLLQLTLAHSHTDSQCNHVHPKPDDVSKLKLLYFLTYHISVELLNIWSHIYPLT